MARTYNVLNPISNLLPAASWPTELAFAGDTLEDALSDVYFTDYELISLQNGVGFELTIVITRELSIEIPGLQGTTLVLAGGAGAGASSFRLLAFLGDEGFELRADDIQLALRFPPSILKPVPATEGDTAPAYAEIAVKGSVSLDEHLDLTVRGFDRLSLAPAMIGDSGVVISAKDVLLSLSRSSVPPEILAAGFDESFLGVFITEAKIKLPDGLPALAPDSLIIRNAAIGSGGVSGRLEAVYGFTYDAASKTYTGDGAGTLFDVPFGVGSAALEIRQNAFQAAGLSGELLLPFFDKRVNVEVGINLDGSIAARLTGVAEPSDSHNPETGLFTLKKGNIFDLEIDSLGFELQAARFTTRLSGKITPRVAGLDWPAFEVKELAIDSDGNVHLEGGWLDLREQYSLNFHGFQMEVTKLGFGKTDDGGKWIGFSGGLKLVKELPAGASVEGLRLIWYEDETGAISDVRITLNEVNVQFEKKGVISFKGKIAYDGEADQFSGAIKLDLPALKLHVDGALVVGRRAGESYMAIYLAVELPAGIPLFATGLALYGMAGLFALEMEPAKQPDQAWYGIGGNSWYHSGTPGVTDLAKWRHQPGSFALGAGVTIGTAADNGYRFSGRMLLVIVMPGPILLIEGKASLLEERAKLDGAEPLFRALAVLDNRANTFLIGIDAVYKYNDDGKLIDLRGSAEAFYDFNDADRWHIYLGLNDPRERRIRAKIFGGLFEAEAYFMLDPGHLAMGAWVGYVKKWKFGPLRVGVEAWIEGNAIISTQPAHLYADLWLHGSAELSVWRFGVNLTVDAAIAADVFDPYHIVGEFKVKIGLPWPLPDFKKTIHLEWGPEPVAPPLSLPLKEIAIEHFKVTTSWPLRRGALLLPNYDGNADGFLDLPAGPIQPADLQQAPVVPIDCRPHLTFSRPVHDDAQVGVNPQPVFPGAQPSGWEWLGDPEKNEGPVRMRSGLKEIALEKWAPSSNLWQVIAKSPAGIGEPKLYGSWAPMPQLPTGDTTPGSEPPTANVKLWLWSKTPFDYTRHNGSEWDDWFTSQYPDYPCLSIPPDLESCCDFEALTGEQLIASPWHSLEEPQLDLSWRAPEIQHVTILDAAIEGRTHALWFPHTVPDEHVLNEITILLARPAKSVKLVLTSKTGVRAVAFDAGGAVVGTASGGTPDNPVVRIEGQHIERVVVHPGSDTFLLVICVVRGPDAEDVTLYEEMEHHLRDELARWSQVGEVLEPHSAYRLRVSTTVETQEFPDASFNSVREQTEYAYFRTDGPPGLTTLSVPDGQQDPETFDSGLDDLGRYVRQTIPPTVPAAGELPVLPRPVYRAYDVGVEFNEDYVDLLYRLDRRDLGLYLYDRNNQPVRDAQGRLIVLSNRWGVTETVTLSESEDRWITIINAGDCATLDTTVIPHDTTLTAAAAGQVLERDTVYEARLVPLLVHDDFGALSVGDAASGPAGVLGAWMVRDRGTGIAPSHWEIREEGTPPSRYVTQTTDIWGGTLDGRDPVKPGTFLLRADNPSLPATDPSQSGNWTDYRVSMYVRSSDDDAIGLVFRYLDESHHYLYAMDRQRRYRRLVRVIGGIHTILAQDDFIYRLNQDYLITVEAVGASLRVYQDGRLVFEIEDDSVDQGGIGLYCWGNNGARFSDVRVDDFGPSAAVVYKFAFTTSQFANFFHHLHSFEDETWRLELPAGDPSDQELTSLIAAALPPGSAVSEAETRAYEAFAASVLGESAHQTPPEVQMTKLTRDDSVVALLGRSPEPIAWTRCDLAVLRTPRHLPLADRAGVVKLTDVDLEDESVSLLLRDALDPTGYRVEYRHAPGPLTAAHDAALLWADEFAQEAGGVLFEEAFGTSALDHYTVVDEATQLGPSSWTAFANRIVQTSPIYGGSVSPAVPDKPGTLAVTGSATWRNVRLEVTLRSPDHGAIGVVFRYQDRDNYYRFSVDRERSYRRLVKKVAGAVTVLYEDQWSSTAGQPHRVVIDAYDDWLRCDVDDALQFGLRDVDLASGSVGLYCWGNAGAQFDRIRAEALSTSPVLWQPTFADIGQVETIDEEGALEGPSMWTVEEGSLIQLVGILVPDSSPHRPGTFALAGGLDWQDLQISVRLRSDGDGALGIMFRYASADRYYRFSMDRAGSYRRLIKKAGGTVTVLWEDAVAYDIGASYEVTLRAVGRELRGYVNGTPLFAVNDGDASHGRVGFYCAGNEGARFDRVVVTDLSRKVGAWTIHDEGTIAAPSSWKATRGSLRQLSDIHSSDLLATDPSKAGTQAVAGDAVWTDYRLVVCLQSDDEDALGVMFRYRNDDNYYRFSLDARRNYRRLVKKVDGLLTTLWESPGGYPAGEAFALTVDVAGSHLSGYVGRDRTFDLHDDAHGSGRIGVYCWANDGVRFERVEVRQAPLDAHALLRDRFADGDVTAWSFVDEGTVSGPSQWVIAAGALRQTSAIHSPPIDRDTLSKHGTLAIAGDVSWTDAIVRLRIRSMDDDAVGVAFRYTNGNNYYRFSMDSERGYRRLVKNTNGVFSSLWEDARGYEVGRTYELTIAAIGHVLRGYLDGVPMFVVEDEDLPAGRIGLYCWNNGNAQFSSVRVYPGALRFDAWLLDEPFDRLMPERWTFIDEGAEDGPSEWRVEAHELRQTSNIHGGSDGADASDKPGTYAVAGDARWSDYRLTVRLRSDDEDGIGAVLRFQDVDNYYRFSMDSQRKYRRLIKKVAGVVTALWEDTAQYVAGREYVVTWDCAGDVQTIYLDGELLITVADGALLQGKAGLYCWANQNARFSEVRVGPMLWAPYYTFGPEVRFPAGTRVRLAPGAVAPDTDALVQRSVTPVGEGSQSRLQATGADLRVIAADGSLGHRRQFLPAAEYSTEDVRVLRKADGTGFFVLVPDSTSATGSRLPPGEYRLRLSYRRDNRAHEPRSMVFSQASDTTSEEVTIDVPWDVYTSTE